MTLVLLRGPLATQSGYGVHSRQVARWLMSKPNIDLKCQFLNWGNTPWLVDPNACDGLIGQLFSRACEPKPDAQFDVSFQVQLPNEWNFDPNAGLVKFARVNVGVTAGVETDKANPAWIEACNRMDAVVVPSNHTKLTLTNTANVTAPLHVVPEAFMQECSVDELPQLQSFSTPFNFLMVGQLTGNNQHNDRKNIFNTLKWIIEAFDGNKDVGVVIKTNNGRNTLIDRDNVVKILKQLISECKRRSPFPRIHLVHGDMSDAEVAALYRHPQVKALVSLTRGEGFGLPTLEAAASGLPIIATGWSGHMDFLKLGKFISVDYQLHEIHPSRIDNQIFMPGTRWAEPNEADFKKKVVKFYNSPSTPKEWALDLQTKVQQMFSFDAVSKKWDEAVGDLLK